jgi:hypothetical protein
MNFLNEPVDNLQLLDMELKNQNLMNKHKITLLDCLVVTTSIMNKVNPLVHLGNLGVLQN